MTQHLAKRSFSLAGHRTSVALEPAFWRALEAMARERGMSLAALVAERDAARAEGGAPLASTLRVFALEGRAGTGEGLCPAPDLTAPKVEGSS